MGGPPKKGFCIVGGIVKEDVRNFLDNRVKENKFESRSKAVGYILTNHYQQEIDKKVKRIMERVKKQKETQNIDKTELNSPPTKNRSQITSKDIEDIRKILHGKENKEEK
jgi:hypothetical protein